MRVLAGARRIGLPLIRAGFLAVAVLPGLSRSAIAQQDPPLSAPILSLDQERLFSQTMYGKAAISRLQADTDALIVENRRIDAALEAEERELTTRRGSFSPEEFRPLAEAFDKKVEEIRNAQSAKSRDLTRRQDEDRQRFFEAATPILGALMLDRGAYAIIDKRAVLLGFEAIDLTASAIARIDEVLGVGTTPGPAGTSVPTTPPQKTSNEPVPLP